MSGVWGSVCSGQGLNVERDWKGQKRSNATHESTTDPEARLFRKTDRWFRQAHDIKDFVADTRQLRFTPHVAQNTDFSTLLG